MNAIVCALTFAGAMFVACGVMFVTVAPQWRRIVNLMVGNRETGFAPLATLAGAERRIAIRRWAAQPVPAAIRHLRAAA
ncbi:hypothetical protein SAMN05192583_0770 [Sphingomonas gellani]|uniref:Uncharacterized protein n=1 Tax=Sphingomonas gellani TaxID=1166340 RepID=A0A1H7ZQD6_9SPHN|nr:hypothetical protein SAMN05192583_0770 [Sphingomonas gellani]